MLPAPPNDGYSDTIRVISVRVAPSATRIPISLLRRATSPQEPVEPIQFRLLDRPLHDAKLMAEGQDLKPQCRSCSKNRPCGRGQCR